MPLLHRLRLFDWLLIAAALTIAVVLTASVVSRAEEQFPPELDAAIDRAVEARLSEGPDAQDRTMFQMAKQAEDWGDAEGAAYFFALVEAAAYFDMSALQHLRSGIDAIDSLVVQAYVARVRERRDPNGPPNLLIDPVPIIPDVTAAIDAGADAAWITVPLEPGSFPEWTPGFVNWRAVRESDRPIAIVGDVRFPSIGLNAGVTIGEHNGPEYLFDISVSFAPSAQMASFTEVRIELGTSLAEGWSPPVDVEFETDQFAFTAHMIESIPSPVDQLLASPGGLTFDGHLSDGRRLKLEVEALGLFLEPLLDEAFAAWGLIDADAAAPAE